MLVVSAALACLSLVPVCAVSAILFVYGYDFPDPDALDERLALLLLIAAALLGALSIVWIVMRRWQRRPVALRTLYSSLVLATLVGAAVGCATLLIHRGVVYIPHADWAALWLSWLAWLVASGGLLGAAARGRELGRTESPTRVVAGALLGLGIGSAVLAARVGLFPCEGFVRSILWTSLAASASWLVVMVLPGVIASRRVVSVGIVTLAAGLAFLFQPRAADPLGGMVEAATASNFDRLEVCLRGKLPPDTIEALGRLGRVDLPVVQGLLAADDWFFRAQAVQMLWVDPEPTTVPAVYRALVDEHPHVREPAADLLGWVGNTLATAALVDLLDDASGDVAGAASSALGSIGGAEAEAGLRQALSDRRPRVRRAAVKSLGVLAPATVLSQLLQATADPDPAVREYALEALAAGERDEEAVTAAFVEAVEDVSAGVRGTAARALGRRRGPGVVRALVRAAGDDVGGVQEAAANSVDQLDDVTSTLAESLVDADPIVRLGAARLFARTGAAGAVPRLAEAGADADPRVRRWAIEALGTVSVPEAAAAVSVALDDPIGSVRRAAIQALPHAVGAASIPTLVGLLESDDADDRAPAALALGELAGQIPPRARRTVVNALVAIVESGGQRGRSIDREFATAAAGTLGALEDPTALAPLTRLLEEAGSPSRQRRSMRNAVVVAIVAIGAGSDEMIRDTAERELLAVLEDPTIGAQAAEGLGRIGSGVALEPLRLALQSDNLALAGASLDSLARLDGPSLVESLNAVVDTGRFAAWSGNRQLTSSTVRHLIDIGTADAFALVERMVIGDVDIVSDLPAIERLGRGGAAAIPILRATLDREGTFWDFLRTAAARALVAMRSPASLALLYDRIGRGNLEAFNVVRKQLVWPRSWEGVANGASETGAAMLTYLEALQAREARQPDRQAALATVALERAPPDLGAPFRLLVGWVRVHAHLALHDIEAARAEATALVALRDHVSQRDRLIYADALAAETSYWLGKAVAASDERDDLRQAQTHQELELRRMAFLSQRLEIRFANVDRQDVLEEFEQRTGEIQLLEDRLQELTARSGPADVPADPADVSDVEAEGMQAELRAKRRALNSYVTRLRQERPEMAALLNADPVDLAMVQTRLPANVALLQYLVLPERLLTFVIRRTSLDIVDTTISQPILAQKVTALRTGIQSTRPAGDLTTLAGELYGVIIGDIERAGLLEGVETLGIVPNGVLHQLPFSALLAASHGGRPLVERYDLFKVSSATLLWLALEQRQAVGAWPAVELLALSNPAGDLPGADAEVDAIATHFERRALFSKKDARKEVLENLRPGRRIVHLATHGVLDPWEPTRSYLVMADGDRLTLGDAWGLPLEHTLLTVLSACDTGIGAILAGDDVVSLESAFLYAGSSSVVATLWPVDDEATAALMQRFYANLASGMEKARALGEAQRWMSQGDTERWRDPYFWAGFSLQGAWN